MEMTEPLRKLDASEEAAHMLSMRGGTTGLAACLDLISQQLTVIQTRSQLLLTLSTLTLTITGFSGPQIARTSPFARVAIVLGISCVLLSTILILLSSLRVKWVTQFAGPDPKTTLVEVLRYRNFKTGFYVWELSLIVLGLASYVASLVTYLLSTVA
ncbi:MAG: hypothetical protein QOD99_2488 [Chthoniobacter sp.]|jgi:hypothetical protein|nr:hypothetical protein [Chthoniobacter sp.]